MADQEKTTPEVEEVKEETTVETVEEVKEEKVETPSEEAKEPEKKEKKAKSGKKGFLIPAIVAGVLVVAALVFTIIMGSSATSAYGAKNYKGAYTSSKMALFLAKQDKDIIAKGYILNVLCPEGKYLTASKILEKTSFTDEQKAEIYAAEPTFALCNEGQVVKFGKYETDNNRVNGAEDLEWIVLDIQEIGGRAYALLLTKDVVGTPGGWNRFADSESATSYAKSNLQSWCETDFYNTFIMQDMSLKGKIVAVNVETGPSADGTSSGEVVQAHAYAPSAEDLEKYLTGDLAQYIKACPTKAAKASGVRTYGAEKVARYYLRNAGNMEDGMQCASAVDKEGAVIWGASMTDSSYGARVCINVDLGEIK